MYNKTFNTERLTLV